MNNIALIKEEAARLRYDRQLIEALSKKMADEEQEIDALRTSNLQAKQKLAVLTKKNFFDSRSSLEVLDDEESAALIDLLIMYPELFKGNEKDIISCLYLMTIFSKEAPFLKLAKNVLLSDTLVVFYVRSQDRFAILHVDDTWKSLICLKLVGQEDYDAFRKKVENVQKRG